MDGSNCRHMDPTVRYHILKTVIGYSVENRGSKLVNESGLCQTMVGLFSEDISHCFSQRQNSNLLGDEHGSSSFMKRG